MKLVLSQNSIGNAVKYTRVLKNEIKDANYVIVSKLTEIGEHHARVLNAAAPQSGVTKSQVMKPVITTTQTKVYGTVALFGENAIYDEFGTGEEGAANPHPMKNDFPLNPYNSGPYIFYNQFANRYQWYYKPMAGKPYFNEYGATSGIPAGKQMYNTTKYIRAKQKDVVCETINNAIKVYNNKKA